MSKRLVFSAILAGGIVVGTPDNVVWVVVGIAVELAVGQTDNSYFDIGILVDSKLVVVVNNKIAVVEGNIDYSYFVGLIVAFCNLFSSGQEFHSNGNSETGY
ncbi:hypothetical protein G9A89_016322 [Geosiphon pyriformis]|nr:hypothetical protein G9A89_016322 [Geosiphon pyriformis]